MRNNKILQFVLVDVIRSKSVIAYSCFLFILTSSMFYVGQDISKIIVSMLSILVIVVPVVTIVLGAIHYYNSSKFIQILLTQPVPRRAIFWGEYFGFSISLSMAFFMGVFIPALLFKINTAYLLLVFIGVILTFIFESFALFMAVHFTDKSKGLWGTILLWFYFSIIYDGIILLVIFLFNKYPLEKILLALTALNPIDISRSIILMKLNISALMGATGAVYQKTLGSDLGTAVAFGLLILWAILPLYKTARVFYKKDF